MRSSRSGCEASSRSTMRHTIPMAIPYQGEAKRAAPGDRGFVEEMACAKVYAPDAGGPKSRGDFDADNILPSDG